MTTMLDTRGSATLSFTEDAFGAFRDRIHSLAENTELARVLAEAAPLEEPHLVPRYVHRKATDEEIDAAEVRDPALADEYRRDGVHAIEGHIAYTHKITIPPADLELAVRALREIGDDVAEDLAGFEHPASDEIYIP